MYINDLHILTYVIAGIIGLFVGQFIDWCNIRLPEYKKVLSRDFFREYLKNCKPKYLLMVITAVSYIALLFFNGLNIDTVAYMFLVPMLISAFAIDLKLQIIPNRLTLTIFETGLVYTFVKTLLITGGGIDIFIDSILGMLTGGGIFLLITLIGGAIAGKEAMGFGDVKLMGALGLFFGWLNMILISVMAFLFAAVVSIIILISRKKKISEYIPFGPFIVIATMIPMYVSTSNLFFILLKIFSLGTY